MSYWQIALLVIILLITIRFSAHIISLTVISVFCLVSAFVIYLIWVMFAMTDKALLAYITVVSCITGIALMTPVIARYWLQKQFPELALKVQALPESASLNEQLQRFGLLTIAVIGSALLILSVFTGLFWLINPNQLI